MSRDALREIRSLSAPVPLPNDELATLLAGRAAARTVSVDVLATPPPGRPSAVRRPRDGTPRAAASEPGPARPGR